MTRSGLFAQTCLCLLCKDSGSFKTQLWGDSGTSPLSQARCCLRICVEDLCHGNPGGGETERAVGILATGLQKGSFQLQPFLWVFSSELFLEAECLSHQPWPQTLKWRVRHPPISSVRVDGVPPRPGKVQLQIPSLHIFHRLPVLLPRIVPVILFHIQAELPTFGAESPPISSGFDRVNSPLYPLGPFLVSSLRFCICL